MFFHLSLYVFRLEWKIYFISRLNDLYDKIEDDALHEIFFVFLGIRFKTQSNNHVIENCKKYNLSKLLMSEFDLREWASIIDRKGWIKVQMEAFFSIFVSRVSETTCEFLVFVEILNYKFSKTYFIWKKFKIQKKSWELKNSVTNSLQNRAIKKVIWEISIIVTLNLTFNFNPLKTDFSLKKFQNQKKSYEWKKLTENSLQNRCIKKYYTWSWDIDGHSLKGLISSNFSI